MLTDLTRAVNALPQNMTSQMFNAIAAVTGQGQNPNATPAQWASSQYGYGGSGGGSSAYHVRGLGRKSPAEGGKGERGRSSLTSLCPLTGLCRAPHEGLHSRWDCHSIRSCLQQMFLVLGPLMGKGSKRNSDHSTESFGIFGT